jgi:hypothetical protein
MLGATVIGATFTPAFYVLIQTFRELIKGAKHQRLSNTLAISALPAFGISASWSF